MDRDEPQVKGAINNTLSFTKAASYCAVRSVLPQIIPSNEGVYRAIEVICPPGTIGNGVLPAACAARGLTGFRMVDCMFGALAMMLPDKVPAAGDGGNTGISIGGYDEARKPFVYVDFTCGAWGGSPWADGLDGNSHMMANMASQSIEVTEAEMPMAVIAYEFVTDKAGAGKLRGGVPFRRDYRFLEHEGMLQVRSDRRDHRPFGLYGGSPGQPSENYLNPDTDGRLLPSKLTMTIHKGDVFRHVLAGGGGWGDPLERDPQAVLRDVRNEVLSAARAKADYGVIVDTAAWRVDEAATKKLRAEISDRARLARGAEGAVARAGGAEPGRRVADMVTLRVGVDIGGTFTDIVVLGSDGSIHTKKVSSSVDDYARAIVDGLAELFAETGLSGAAIDEIRHGTTVASNAILERKGARVGLITTKGFRDVLEIRTLRMPRLYDLTWTKPLPLVERYLRKVVDERIDYRGNVERALDPADAARVVDALLAEKRRGDRGLPDQFVHQSGARADGEGDRAAQGAAHSLERVLRGAARDQGIRAHLDDDDQRLCDADRRDLSARIARRARRRRNPGAAAADAVEWRADHRQGCGGAADEHRRVRPGRRRGRRAGGRALEEPPEDHHLRHGRHHREGLDGRERRGDARAGVCGRRRHHDRLAAAHRRGLYAESAGDRSRRSRRRRRLACLDRRGRRVADRAAKARAPRPVRSVTTRAARCRP